MSQGRNTLGRHGSKDRNLRELRAEVSSAKEQMNTDNMDQIVSTLQSLAKGKASAV